MAVIRLVDLAQGVVVEMALAVVAGTAPVQETAARARLAVAAVRVQGMAVGVALAVGVVLIDSQLASKDASVAVRLHDKITDISSITARQHNRFVVPFVQVSVVDDFAAFSEMRLRCLLTAPVHCCAELNDVSFQFRDIDPSRLFNGLFNIVWQTYKVYREIGGTLAVQDSIQDHIGCQR